MSDEQQAPPEPVEAEHPAPGPEHERATGDAGSAPAAQPRQSDSDTTA